MYVQKPHEIRILPIPHILPIGGEACEYLCARDELLGGRVGEGLDRHLNGLLHVVIDVRSIARAISELLLGGDKLLIDLIVQVFEVNCGVELCGQAAVVVLLIRKK